MHTYYCLIEAYVPKTSFSYIVLVKVYGVQFESFHRRNGIPEQYQMSVKNQLSQMLTAANSSSAAGLPFAMRVCVPWGHKQIRLKEILGQFPEDRLRAITIDLT